MKTIHQHLDISEKQLKHVHNRDYEAINITADHDENLKVYASEDGILIDGKHVSWKEIEKLMKSHR